MKRDRKKNVRVVFDLLDLNTVFWVLFSLPPVRTGGIPVRHRTGGEYSRGQTDGHLLGAQQSTDREMIPESSKINKDQWLWQ